MHCAEWEQMESKPIAENAPMNSQQNTHFASEIRSAVDRQRAASGSRRDLKTDSVFDKNCALAANRTAKHNNSND